MHKQNSERSVVKIFSFGIWIIMFITFLSSGILNAICMKKINNRSTNTLNFKKIIYIVLAIIRGTSCIYLTVSTNAEINDGAYCSSSSDYVEYSYKKTITQNFSDGISGIFVTILLILLVISIVTIINALYSKKDKNVISYLIGIVSRILICAVGMTAFSYQSGHFPWILFWVGITDIIATDIGFSIIKDTFK